MELSKILELVNKEFNKREFNCLFNLKIAIQNYLSNLLCLEENEIAILRKKYNIGLWPCILNFKNDLICIKVFDNEMYNSNQKIYEIFKLEYELDMDGCMFKHLKLLDDYSNLNLKDLFLPILEKRNKGDTFKTKLAEYNLTVEQFEELCALKDDEKK